MLTRPSIVKQRRLQVPPCANAMMKSTLQESSIVLNVIVPPVFSFKGRQLLHTCTHSRRERRLSLALLIRVLRDLTELGLIFVFRLERAVFE